MLLLEAGPLKHDRAGEPDGDASASGPAFGRLMMRQAFRAKGARGKLVFTLLAALGVAFGALRRGPLSAREHLPALATPGRSITIGLRWIYERIHFDPRPIDVVILGPSRSQLGFNPAAIEQQSGAHGKQVNVVNFAISKSPAATSIGRSFARSTRRNLRK